ncbi:MAG: bifunctional metallophosphatase/5'-nucleotidase [Pseudolabrys sp.]
MTSRLKAWTILGAGALVLALVAGLAPASFAREPRTVTFLAINDIYRLEGVADNTSGGLTRVRTLRRAIERDAPNAILLHAGDFLSPSLVSRMFKGAQMIDVLNNLDGDANAFDARMFVAFGNHEFDESTCNRPDAPLNARVAESQFTWLAANLDFPNCPSMNWMLSRKNVKKDGVVIEADGVKVGLFGIGLTPDTADKSKYPPFDESLPAAKRSIDTLRKAGAELIVALTHLPREDDEALLKELAPAGLDLLVGGHDHTHMTLKDGQGVARGFKADSDARTAWRIDVHVPAGARPRVTARLMTLDSKVIPDPNLTRLAKAWTALAEEKICLGRAKKGQRVKPGCLNTIVGRTRSLIELEETPNRSQETGFGDWLADAMLRETKADVAIVNSGILGLNEDLAPGTRLSVRHVVDIFRFDDVVAVRSYPAKTVCKTIEHGLVLQGTGAWPHLGGVTVEVTRAGDNYEKAAVKTFTGKPGVTCDSDTPIKVAAVPYLLCGGDKYPFPVGANCMAELEARPYETGNKPALLMSRLAEAAIRAAKGGIKPEKDGRVKFIEAGGK